MIYLSPLNPLRFDSPKDEGYVQKFGTNDDISIQAIIDTGLRFDAFIGDEDGNILYQIAQAKERTVSGKSWQTWKVACSGIFNQYPKLTGKHTVILRDSNLIYSFFSNVFCVSEENLKLPRIHYRNYHNKDDVWYGIGDDMHVNMFSIRVEGGFQINSDNTKSINTINMGGDGRYRLLHSVTYFTKIFTAGNTFGMPFSLFKTIACAFDCDTVYIDNEGYVKYQGAEWQPSEIERYPLRTWNLEVVPTGIKLLLATWSDYACQIDVQEPEDPNAINLISGDLNLISNEFNLINAL